MVYPKGSPRKYLSDRWRHFTIRLVELELLAVTKFGAKKGAEKATRTINISNIIESKCYNRYNFEDPQRPRET